MLLGDVADEPVPPCDGGWCRIARPPFARTLHSARRSGGDDEHHLRAVERGDGAGQRVPRVLTNEQRGTPPTRVERTDAESALDEALLIEHPVGGQEVFAMDVHNAGPTARIQCDVRRAVVERPFVCLVKANDRVDVPVAARRLVRVAQRGGECRCRGGGLANRSLDEVSREHRLGELDDVGHGIECRRLREDLADTRDVRRDGALRWPELRDGKVERRHIWKKARTLASQSPTNM